MASNNQHLYQEWGKFLAGEKVEPKIVSSTISASWKRSKNAGVEPYHIKFRCLNEEEKERKKMLVRKYDNGLIVIRKTAIDMGLNFQLFDSHAQSIKKFNFTDYLAPEEIKFNKPEDLSESVVGTNAICLALQENKPVQLRGYENYSTYFHDFYCTAAPIHDVNGEIIGAINTFSYKEPQTRETMGLIGLLANLFDNLLLISNASEDKVFYDFTINEIMKHLPYGLILLDGDGLIKHYNDKVLKDLKIRNSSNVNSALSEYLSNTNCLDSNGELEKNEVILDIEGVRRSFLISTKGILDLNNKIKGRIIIFEDTQSLLKSANRLRGNRAVFTFEDIIGNSREIVSAKSLSQKVATAPSSVLIMGESGTGKELFAQAIHNASLRKDNPFIALNCGAIPADLLESELFGYEAGAFTGASKGGKPGLIELADDGTLFLDEIESMSLNMQIKLLRVFSSGTITKIGGREAIPVNIRVISATKKDLLAAADEGSFREDLYYRITTFVIKLPALRERKGDIPILIDYFIKKHIRQFNLSEIEVTEEFIEALTNYQWRGNIRELQNEIERCVVLLGEEHTLTAEYIHERIVKEYLAEKMKRSLASASKMSNNRQGLLNVFGN